MRQIHPADLLRQFRIHPKAGSDLRCRPAFPDFPHDLFNIVFLDLLQVQGQWSGMCDIDPPDPYFPRGCFVMAPSCIITTLAGITLIRGHSRLSRILGRLKLSMSLDRLKLSMSLNRLKLSMNLDRLKLSMTLDRLKLSMSLDRLKLSMITRGWISLQLIHAV